MSVIRGPSVLGQRTQRRFAGTRAAISGALVETIAVGTWFTLVVIESRSIGTALVGLGVLLIGATLKTSVAEVSTSYSNLPTLPQKFLSAVLFAGIWVTWLLIAEWVGGIAGIALAGIVLWGLSNVQFVFERQAATHGRAELIEDGVWNTVKPGLLQAVGATLLLSVTWYVDWSVVVLPIVIEDVVPSIEVGAFALGFVCYGLVTFLAQRHRFRRAIVG